MPSGDSYDKTNPITFIRATELKPDLQIDFKSAYKVPQDYFNKRSEIKQNDILIAVKGATIASNKSVAFVEKELQNTIINGSIFKIRVNNLAIPKYIAYILDSNIIKKQMKYNLIANNAVDYLDRSVIYNLLIPLPDINTQNKIANHIKDIRDEAKRLQQEAKEELKRAKIEVEKIILGEANANNTRS